MDLALSTAESLCLGLIGGLGVGATIHITGSGQGPCATPKTASPFDGASDMQKVLGHVQAKRLADLTEYFVAAHWPVEGWRG